MELTILALMLIFAFDVMLLIILFKLSRVLESEDKIKELIKRIFLISYKKNNNSFYNARKRDENLLRELHRAMKENAVFAKEGDPRDGFKEISKQCRSIDNVVRQISNQNLVLENIIKSNNKLSQDSNNTLKLFQEIIKNSNKKTCNSDRTNN